MPDLLASQSKYRFLSLGYFEKPAYQCASTGKNLKWLEYILLSIYVFGCLFSKTKSVNQPGSLQKAILFIEKQTLVNAITVYLRK